MIFNPDVLVLNVQSLNVQSVNSLEIDVSYFYQIHFLCLTETHCNNELIKIKHINNFSLSSYYCRNTFEKGGVAIYSRSSLNVKAIDLSQFCTQTF